MPCEGAEALLAGLGVLRYPATLLVTEVSSIRPSRTWQRYLPTSKKSVWSHAPAAQKCVVACAAWLPRQGRDEDAASHTRRPPRSGVDPWIPLCLFCAPFALLLLSLCAPFVLDHQRGISDFKNHGLYLVCSVSCYNAIGLPLVRAC